MLLSRLIQKYKVVGCFFQNPYKFKKNKLSSLQNVLIFSIFVVGYFFKKKKKNLNL